MRGLLSLVALLALLLAPFGRAAAAEAVPDAHHSATATAGHCDEPAHGQPKKDDARAIDCMIACATIAAADSTALEALDQAAAPLVPLPVARFTGLRQGADPPPPRIS